MNIKYRREDDGPCRQRRWWNEEGKQDVPLPVSAGRTQYQPLAGRVGVGYELAKPVLNRYSRAEPSGQGSYSPPAASDLCVHGTAFVGLRKHSMLLLPPVRVGAWVKQGTERMALAVLAKSVS